MKKVNDKRQDETLNAYFDQIKDIPLLSFEEELELSQRIQSGDESARRRLIEANLRLVIKIARGYLTSDVSFMDLIQEGNMGLMKAVEKYDHQKQVRFSTYAAWWIRQVISRYMSDKRRTIRLPHRKEEMLRKIQHAYHRLSQLHMRQPKPEELANETGLRKDDVEFVMSFAHDVLSIDASSDNDESVGVIELHADYTYNPEKALIQKSTREAALKMLNNLKENERNVLINRYQLNGGDRSTLKSIGTKLGLSTETVRQIELRAIQKLRLQAQNLDYQEAI